MFGALIRTVEQTGQRSIAGTVTRTTKTMTTDLLDMPNKTDSEGSQWIQLVLPRRLSTWESTTSDTSSLKVGTTRTLRQHNVSAPGARKPRMSNSLWMPLRTAAMLY